MYKLREWLVLINNWDKPNIAIKLDDTRRNDNDVTKAAQKAVARGILNSRRIRRTFHRSIMGRLSGWCSTKVGKTFPSRAPALLFSLSLSPSLSWSVVSLLFISLSLSLLLARTRSFPRALFLVLLLSGHSFQGSNLLLLAQALPDNETKGTEYDIVVQRPVGKGSYCRSLWILKSTIDTARGMRL